MHGILIKGGVLASGVGLYAVRGILIKVGVLIEGFHCTVVLWIS